jgi:hypothetical protein
MALPEGVAPVLSIAGLAAVVLVILRFGQIPYYGCWTEPSPS